MPNWCDNMVRISHADESKIDWIATNSENLLNFLRPLDKCAPDYDWYQTSIAEWGTKWDVEYDCDRVDAHTVKIRFASAWSPPIEAFQFAVSKGGYSIDAYYCEPGMWYSGHWSDGKLTYHNYLPDEFREAFGVVFDEEGDCNIRANDKEPQGDFDRLKDCCDRAGKALADQIRDLIRRS